MNNPVSKIHKRYSERLNNPRVLTNPEEFLGPNYKAVLNYWMILDELFEDQWSVIIKPYKEIYRNHWYEWDKLTDEVFNASEETIGEFFTQEISNVTYDFYVKETTRGCFAEWTTRELIGMHKILEQQKPLIFFNMFLEVL